MRFMYNQNFVYPMAILVKDLCSRREPGLHASIRGCDAVGGAAPDMTVGLLAGGSGVDGRFHAGDGGSVFPD